MQSCYLQGAGGQGLSGVGAMAAGGIGAFSGMQFGNMAAGMGILFGGCRKVDIIRLPDMLPRRTCGLESSGKWKCAGRSALDWIASPVLLPPAAIF